MGGVYQLDRERFEEFRRHLKALGFKFEERPHQVFLARYNPLTVNLYKSGKLTFGGNDPILQREVEWFLSKLGAKADKPASGIGFDGKMRIGTDESGKGDFFGPLVVAGVLVTPETEKALQKAGVRDSKKVGTDKRIAEIARGIKDFVGQEGFNVVTIGPAKYNELHEKMGSVNRILGWAHARVMENLLKENADCRLAIADQFGDPDYISRSLMEKGRRIELIQIHKGERDIAVASASILAREAFLISMSKMNEEFGMYFPRGASEVIEAAKEFSGRYGKEKLNAVAKMHFSTSNKL
ncbi:MAG TPA: ribonuclease HIII [Thermoplasmata archaeon]|nr:ribonuclease HIII [Thermoplasmata archaeon]